MSKGDLDKLLEDLKVFFGSRVKSARLDAGYSSQEKMAADATFDRGTLRDIERFFSGASFKTAVEISEITGKPLATLFPSYLLSKGPDERDAELDLLRFALLELSLDDIRAVRVVIERLAEHRKESDSGSADEPS